MWLSIHVTIAGSWFELMIMFSACIFGLNLIQQIGLDQNRNVSRVRVDWHNSTHQVKWEETLDYPPELANHKHQTEFTTSCPFISHVIHVNMFIVWKTWPFVLTFSSFHAVSDSPWDIKIHPSNFSAPSIVLGTCRSLYSSSKDGAPEVSHVSWGRTEKTWTHGLFCFP